MHFVSEQLGDALGNDTFIEALDQLINALSISAINFHALRLVLRHAHEYILDVLPENERKACLLQRLHLPRCRDSCAPRRFIRCNYTRDKQRGQGEGNEKLKPLQ